MLSCTYFLPTVQHFYTSEGGGWCNSDSNCLSRSKTALGSSKGYAAAISQESGYFSDDPTINPMMWNWTKVYLPYCECCSGHSIYLHAFFFVAIILLYAHTPPSLMHTPRPLPTTLHLPGDGGSQTGDLTAPVSVGSETIYYRGKRILNAMIPALKTRGLASATDLVISGCSAGGLSTFLHAG